MAEHDGKVTFDLELDDSKIRGELSRALNQIKSQANGANTKIKVDADTSAAMTNMSRVKAETNALNGSTATVHANATVEAAIDGLNDVEGEVDDLNGRSATVFAESDVSAAVDGLNDVEGEVDDLNGRTSTVNVNANDSATEVLENVRAIADELNGKEVNINVNGGGSTFRNGVVQGIGQSVGNRALGMAQGAIGSIFSSGIGYESGLAKASTLMPAGADKEAFGAALLGLATDMGMDIGTMTEATYNALSASQNFGNASGDQMINFLRTASKTAVGGFSDTNSVATAMAKTINAYGMDTSEGDRVANVMLKTQNRGITDVDKLSSSLSHVTATAANANVSFEQVGAMLATLTAQGVETAEATTQSRSLINELVKTDTTANKNMQAALQGTEWSGKSLPEIMAMGGNVVDIVAQISDYAEKKGLTMTDMFSSVEAAQAAQMLLVNSGETFRDNLSYMEDEASVVDEAYSTMAETTEQSLSRIKAQFAGYAAQIFTALGPAITKFLEVLESDRFKGAVGALVDKLAAIMDGNFVESVADSIVNLLNWILDFINDPWGTITSGITSALETAWGWLMGKAGEFGEWIKTAIQNAIDSITWPEWVQNIAKFFGGDESTKTSTEPTTTYSNTKGEKTTNPYQSAYGNPKAYAEYLRSGGKPGTTGTTKAAESMTAAMETVTTNATETAKSETAAAEAMSEAAESAAEVNTNANTLKGDMYGTGVAMRTSESHARRMASSAGTATNRLSSAASSLSSLGSAIASLIASANAAASKARAGASVSAPKATAYAVGLDYVPYDNYPALLHKGEMILTAAEASSYRNTSITTNNNGMSVDALRAAFAGLAFDIDGRRAGMLVERGVSTQQGVRLNRQSYRG